jgi:3-oxoacyl-[acyl-carrier-protein] synthase II
MKLAMNEGGVTADEIDYINTHSTSTPVGDVSEMLAVSKLFESSDRKATVSATKSMTGHLLGAAGAMEGFLTVKAVQNDIIPPTINTQTIDEEIPSDIDIVLGEAREQKVNVAMSNNFGFGGHNGIVVFKKI